MYVLQQKRRIIFLCFTLLMLLSSSACQGNPTQTANKIAISSTISASGGTAATVNGDMLLLPRHGSSSTAQKPSTSVSPTASATASATATTTTGGTVSGGGIPAGFPKYFSFGVMNAPGSAQVLDGMRNSNGTVFDFRYQYLTGGVNTGSGWETWNQPAGAFAGIYMQESAQHGYIPTFVYYELCLSNGLQPGSYCGAHNLEQDTGNIANPTTMYAYYTNWVLMLQQIGTFKKPALVIVEPDLWGFLQNASNGSNNAATVPASVSSSGYADAAGFPNTVQGFTWALLHMRDKYAPNAILALHASCWAANDDVATDTRSDMDVQGVVQREAAFLNSAGIVGNPAGVSSWDVLSNDVADFDSAQPGGRSWWDRYNKTFPNFARYLQFIGLLSQQTNRRVVMWQVPVGNQYFDTMNNTQGHYQDNRAEYILGNVQSFANAGVISVLFGPGNGGTSNLDAQKDGITNPAPISTYECNMCNTHTSVYPDDDGGYLRIFIGAYMAHPVPIS